MPLLPTKLGRHPRRLNRLRLLLLVLLMVTAARGQHYTFSTYGRAAGLGNLNVTTLVEDHTGVVWVGTENGVFTADGSRFQKQDAFSNAGLEFVRAMREDGAGRIWAMDSHHLVYWENGKVHPIEAFSLNIKTTGGVDLLCVQGQRDGIYLLRDGELLRIASGDGGRSWQVSAAFGANLQKQHPELLRLSSVVSSGGSTLWAGCGKALCSVDLQAETVRTFDVRQGLRPDTWKRLLFTRSGALWARGERTVERLSAGASRFATAGILPRGSYLNVPLANLVEDPAGNVLVNLAEGIAKTDGKVWQVYNRKNGMPQDEISTLLFDHSGGLWLGPSGHGISHWLGYGNWEGWTQADGLSSNMVWGMTRDKTGDVWVATGGGLDRLNPQTGRIRPQGRHFPFNRLTSVVGDQRQHMWTADALGRVIDFDPVSGRARISSGPLDQVTQILVDRQERVWVCSQKGLDYFIPVDNWSKPHRVMEPSLPTGKTYAISEARSGVLWVTTQKGLFRLDGNTWTAIRLPFQGGDVFYNLLLAAAPDGTLWVQRTGPASILHLKVVEDAAVVIDRVDDSIVASENINFINFDSRGWLWVGSDLGVQVFDGVRWVRCTAEDGLLWDDTDSFAFFADPDGSIWIGTSAGVSHLLHPEQVFRSKPPLLQLTNVYLGGIKLEEGGGQEIDVRRPVLSADIFSTNYDREGAIVVRYRLEGQENAWRETTNGSLRFPALGPGKYKLSVMAFDRRLRESSAVHSVSFTVMEAWWNRRWFRLIELLGALALLLGLWRLSVHLLVARQTELETLVALRTREIEQEKAELFNTRSALEAGEARYRKLIDLSPNAIIVGQNHAIVLANKAAVELFGVASASDLIGGRFADFISPEARGRTDEVIQRMYECETQLPLQEGQIRRKDGSLLEVEIAASSFSENGGGVVQAVVQNITQRKQAEAENARLIRSIEQVDESIVITDLEESIVYVNPAFEKITGYSRAEAIGNNLRILKSGCHPASFYQSMWATLLRGETWYGELINKRKDGTLFNEEATISPIKNKDGKVVNYVAVKRDVTREILLRDQLNQAQKMEAVGRLAGGIAHDFNNLLMVIQSYTEMLQDSLPVNDALRRKTGEILKAAARGASLTGQMLAFSRKQIISPVVLALNAVIGETTKMLKRIIGEDIEFQVVSAESLWAIRADPDQIVQVLMNLCINSRDAMPQGGTLTVSTENVAVEEGSVDAPACVAPGDYVRLSVTDTGTGISKELQERIFEPFFTTKEVSKGTGLGLAIVYGIVKQSRGYIWVDSKPGQGTCFTIYLPRIRDEIAREISATVEARPRGTEILLVAEDEEALREAICDYLRSFGYTVLAASSGQQALLVASQQGHIDLLITDILMPKMGGRELSQTLGSLRPGLKTIYMSGYTDDAVLRHGILELGAHFLQKPFSLGTLARKVRDTLGRIETVQ